MKTTAERSRTKQASKTRVSPSHEEISVRAEAIWLKRGCPLGADEEIWLEAERLLGLPGAAQGLRPTGFKSDSVITDLDELYPGPTGRETTSL
jgi:Protein of unknown function (DUF2934)